MQSGESTFDHSNARSVCHPRPWWLRPTAITTKAFNPDTVADSMMSNDNVTISKTGHCSALVRTNSDWRP